MVAYVVWGATYVISAASPVMYARSVFSAREQLLVADMLRLHVSNVAKKGIVWSIAQFHLSLGLMDSVIVVRGRGLIRDHLYLEFREGQRHR